MSEWKSGRVLCAAVVLILLGARSVEGKTSRHPDKGLPTVPPDRSATPGPLPTAAFDTSFELGDSKTRIRNPLQRNLVTGELESELRANHYDKVIDLCDAALKASTERRQILLRFRGQAYAGKGEFRLALDDYAEAIKYDQEFPWAYLERGVIYQSAKRWTSAAKDFLRAIELSQRLPLDHDFATLFNYLAWLRATCPDRAVRDGEAAVRWAKRACELSKWEEANIVDTMAAAYAEAGDFSKAAAFQEEALWMDGVTQKDRAGMEDRLALYREHKSF